LNRSKKEKSKEKGRKSEKVAVEKFRPRGGKGGKPSPKEKIALKQISKELEKRFTHQ